MGKKVLRDRAEMLARARAFFAERNVLEVDTGALVRCPPNDSNVDVIGVDQDNGYLHTSPEYAMKRLLSAGLGDCYFLGHVYRKGELGHLHNPEFTMVEWYRVGITFAAMIQETCDFLSLFFGPKPIRLLSYRQAFQDYLSIDYSSAPLSDLHRLTHSSWPRDVCIHYLISHHIEPKLGLGELTVLTDFPPHEAALACVTQKNGETVAERYEIYHEGVELTNGYHELSDAGELRRRFEEKNRARLAEGKEPYALDEQFLAALQTLPDCCGVALGFDRALMLRHNLKSIKPVIPFAWDEL
ncbi:MAG TPA: EF-P lysine aminoacylase EpmA [Chlamydiales bacterium]|nr:EF-P lysine aminoacylase EpmA [Chlamydiales bacterium]